MSTAAQRKAWNEAMRSAAGTAALPAALQPTKRKRRSDRTTTTGSDSNNNSKAGRRERARKSVQLGGDEESKEFLAAAWMDALEDVPATAAEDGGGGGDDDEDYDELEELDDQAGTKKRKTKGGGGRRGSAAAKRPKKSASSASASTPKRFRPRSLASILLEEVNRADDGVAYAWLDNEARQRMQRRPPKAKEQSNRVSVSPSPSSSSVGSITTMPPPRKFCPVTGMPGIYIEPKTHIPYASLPALEQIRERPPPWMTLGGSIAYHEAVKSIRGEQDA